MIKGHVLDAVPDYGYQFCEYNSDHFFSGAVLDEVYLVLVEVHLELEGGLAQLANKFVPVAGIFCKQTLGVEVHYSRDISAKIKDKMAFFLFYVLALLPHPLVHVELAWVIRELDIEELHL